MLICLKKIDESVFETKILISPEYILVSQILIPPEYILVSKLYGIIRPDEKQRSVKIEIDENDECRYRCDAKLHYIQSLNHGCIYFEQDSKLANVLKKVFSVSYKYIQDRKQIPSNETEFIALYSKEDESDVLIAKRIKREDEEDLGSDINRDLGIVYFDLGIEYYKRGNKNAALDYFSKAAEREIPEAQNNLGAMYYEEKARSKYKKDDIINILKKAAGKGIVEALFNLGNIYFRRKEYADAISYYERAAQKGYTKARYNLGAIYHNGDGVERDELKSKKWLAMCPPDLNLEARKRKIPEDPEDQNKLGEEYYEEGNYELAFELFNLAAEQGNTDAMDNLGDMYDEGYGVEKDKERALMWHLKARGREMPKDAEEQNEIGEMCREEGDYEQAHKLFTLAAKQGNTDAMDNLGDMYANGYWVEKNEEEAERWYSEARKRKIPEDPEDQNKLGEEYYKEGDYEQAHKLFKLAAEQGNANAMNNLADMYDKGLGVEKDKERALMWYLKAQGRKMPKDAEAQNELGEEYYEEGNYELAFELFIMAAEQDNTDAINNLGIMYLKGEYVTVNSEKALELFTMAEEQGNTDAMDNLGDMYDEGYGVEKDKEKALMWHLKAQGREMPKDAEDQNKLGEEYYEEGDYEQAHRLFNLAAEQGNANAMNNLADMYDKGLGVEKNDEEARKWRSKAIFH